MRARDLLLLAMLGSAGLALGQPAGPSARSTGTRPAHERIAPAAKTDLARALIDQGQQVTRTRDLLVADVNNREGVVRARVRSAYQALYRTSWGPQWAVGSTIGSAPGSPSMGDSGASHRRRAVVQARQRAGIRRILDRDLRELDQVRAELTRIQRAGQRVQQALAQTQDIPQLAPGTLHNPVAYSTIVEPFGPYSHRASDTHLSRRGVVLSSQVGRNVRAAADGHVRYLGEVRGLGFAALLDHGDYFTLYAPLTRITTQVDARIARADIIGESASERVYFEVRMADGAAGVPVDPQPLLAL